MKAKEVKVLRAENNSKLTEMINEHLKKGWHMTETLTNDETHLYSIIYKE